MRSAEFVVTVAGTNISGALRPVLTRLTVTDNAGTHSDSADIEVDDTGGRILLPQHGAAVSIALGWSGEGVREIFTGTVDEIRSSGSKQGGRTLRISARGVDTTGKAKEGQSRHFDQMTVADVLRQAGEYAGITGIDVDPDLAGITLPYIDMRAESFIHLGERIGALIGGNFRVNGVAAVMAKRAGSYAAAVTAAHGVNLISWDIAPLIGRGRYAKAQARAYDMDAADEIVVDADTGIDGADATVTRRDLLADEDEAGLAAGSDAATSQERSGGGTIVIDGSTDAVPDGRCVLTGARPGIDGAYLIKTVTHSLDKGGGWVTSLQVAHPQDGAGTDKRSAASSDADAGASGANDAALDDIIEGTGAE